MLETGAHPRTTNKWEDLGTADQTWDNWKTSFKAADMKERVHRLVTYEHAAQGVMRQSYTPPDRTAIEKLVNKDDLEDYFDNLAAAAMTKKAVLEQLTQVIATLTMNNATLVTLNSKLTAEVANLIKNLGKNTGGNTGGRATNKRSPTTCTHCQKRRIPQTGRLL